MMLARSVSANRLLTAAWPNAQSTATGSPSLASPTASAILIRIRVVPAAAASVNHNLAPTPRSRNSCSAALLAFGCLSSAPAGAGGKCSSSIRGLPGVARGCRATSTGPASPTCTITTRSPPRPDSSSVPWPWTRTHTVRPSRRCGTEYWPPSWVTIGVFAATVRVTPNATVCGATGSGCNRARSSASMSAGTRRVTRCTRMFTVSQNAWQAASSSANDA